MRLINIEPEEFGIRKDVRIIATSVGSTGTNQMLFLIPINGGDIEQDEDLWDVLPTTSGKPKLVANAAPAPGGVIVKLSTLNRSGKRIGHIYIRERDLEHVVCVGYGVAGTEGGNITWEEAVFRVEAPAVFYLVNVGPPNEFVVYDGEEVIHQPASDSSTEFSEDDYIRVDDPRVRRWKPPEDFKPHAKNEGHEISASP